MRNYNMPPTTPLLQVLRQLATDERRQEFAALAGTSVAYLYQIAGCNRGSPRSLLAKGIADASVVMHERYGSDVLTLDTVITMCLVEP